MSEVMPVPAPNQKRHVATVRRIPFEALCLLFAAIVFLGRSWGAWCLFPSQVWNDVRLRTAFLLEAGLPLYPGLDQSPVTTWMYGPLLPVLLIPATWTQDYLTSLQVAGALNLLLWVLPIWICCAFWPAAEGQSIRVNTRAVIALLVTLLTPVNYWSFLSADAACFAAGLLSLLCLSLGVKKQQSGLLHGAALLGVASALAKPHGVFVLLAQAMFVLLATKSVRAAALHSIRILISSAAGLLVLTFVFSTGLAWWDHLVRVPGNLPWRNDPLGDVLTALPAIAGLVLLPLAVSISHLVRNPQNPASAGALAALFTLPFGLAAFLKFGGNTNSLHGALYLTPVLLGMAGHGSARVQARVFAPALATLAVTMWALPSAISLPREPLTEGARESQQLISNAPDELWLPWRPLAVYLTTGRHDHDEDGLFVRMITGHFPDQRALRTGLPPLWQATALESQAMKWGLAERLAAHTRNEFGRWELFLVSDPPFISPASSTPSSASAP